MRLLDGRLIHDAVEHVQDTREKPFQKGSWVGMKAPLEELLNAPFLRTTKRLKGALQLLDTSGRETRERPLALPPLAYRERGKRLAVN